MKSQILFYFLIIIAVFNCLGQSKPIEFYSPEFKWSIVIPDDFLKVTPDNWRKLKDRGENMIKDTYGEKPIDQSVTIFAFKKDDYNTFESNYQPFNEEVDGDYMESYRNVNTLLFETFKAQIPNAKIDSLSTIQKVNGLEFQNFNIKITFTNGLKMRVLMYSRLFDDKEFSVNITYLDENLGIEMMKAWANSKFQ